MPRILAITVCSLVLVAGCGKKEEPEATGDVSLPPAESTDATAASTAAPAPAPGSETLPGAAAVRAAMEKKDYAGAVGTLLAMGGSAKRGEDQWTEYVNLFGEVKYTLNDLAPTDPKAAEALMTLRAIQSGR